MIDVEAFVLKDSFDRLKFISNHSTRRLLFFYLKYLKLFSFDK